MAKSRVELVGSEELGRKIKLLGDLVRQANSAAARAAAEPIRMAAIANAPGPFILARQSKLNSTDERAVVDIGPDKEHYYYQFFETGAGAHEIKNTPKYGKKFLVFEGRRGTVVTRRVRHPGITARPFLRQAMNRNRARAQQVAGEVFLREIKKLCVD